MTDREAMQMAIDALENSHANEPIWKTPIKQAIEALRTALAQPEPDPVQWQKRHTEEWENTNEHDAKWWRDNSKGWEIRALYTAPPQRKPLSDDELLAALKFVDSETARLPNGFKLFARAIEAAHGIRKEK